MQEWWRAADVELLAGLRELQTRLHSTYAEMLTVIAEADSRRVGAAEGFGSTADLLHYFQRIPAAKRGPGSRLRLTCCRVARCRGSRWRRGCPKPPPPWPTE